MTTWSGREEPGVAGLRIERLSKRFGDFIAVADVDLHVRRGEILTLLGPSGSGKTTLLLMLAGFVEPTSGDLRLDGRSIRSLAPEKREFGMVFQGYALFPHMTVRRNVAYPLEVRKRSRDAVRQRVDEMLALVQLDAFADRLPRQLSGGQQQRVALARALSFDPRVLLLDEPLGALDKKLRGEMQLQLKRLHRKIGTTFVYVTHDQEEALSMSDRVAIMNHGSTVQVGSPTELYERPATTFAASFLGESNFLRGVVTGRHGGCATYRIAGQEYRQDDPGRRLETGAPITLALRPEKLEVATASEDGAGPNLMTGVVSDVSYLGSTLAVSVMTGAAGALTAEVRSWGGPRVARLLRPRAGPAELREAHHAARTRENPLDHVARVRDHVRSERDHRLCDRLRDGASRRPGAGVDAGAGVDLVLGLGSRQGVRLSIRPGIFGGAVFAFILSWDEIVVALFIAKFRISTLPRRMWDGIRENTDPTVAAAAVVLTAVTIAVIAFSLVFARHTRPPGAKTESGEYGWTSS